MHSAKLLGYTTLLWFAVAAHGESTCNDLKITYERALQCAEENAPALIEARLEVERASAGIEAAGQWKNPELAIESYHGKVGSNSTSETDINLGVPIEPGKIGARKRVAQAGVTAAEAVLYEARAAVRSEMMLKLHRLRQLFHQEDVLQEAIGTFEKLVSQFSRRPKLSPEQELSRTVFQMSKSDYDLKRSALLEERAALDAFFRLRIGRGVDALKNALPGAPTKWPEIDTKWDPSRSPRLRRLAAEADASKAELSLAKLEAWPTVSAGPSVKLVNEGGRADQLYGFNVSLPLPLFNINGGARRVAQAGVKVNEQRKTLGTIGEQKRREELIGLYNQSVATLGGTLSHPEVERRHHESERLFLQGLVPSSLVIEAHRTYVDLEQARHQRELRALEALFELYTLDGKILEKTL